MSSEFPDRLRLALRRRALGLRLLLGYAVLFAVSAVVLFGLAYVLFVEFMREPDRDFLEGQTRELAAVYAESGLDGLRAELASEMHDTRREELIVRLADLDSETLFLYNPDDWKPAELRRLASHPMPEQEAWLRLGPAEDDDALEAFAVRLADGGVLQVGMDSDVREDVLESMREVFLAIALPVLILALLGGAIMAYRALQPIRDLLSTLQTIVETGDVQERAPVEDAGGEFAEMVRLFNRMLDRIEALLMGMRDTLDNVAHDLRTPMTRLRGMAELALQQDRDPAAYREALADSIEVSETVLTMLNTLMEVSEAETGTMVLTRESVSLARVAEDVADLYRFVAEENGVDLIITVPAELHVIADAGRLRQVLANLVDNSIKYTPPGGCITVSAARQSRTCTLHVQDTGIGIPPQDLPKIWDRLYRGDRSRSERGLGLGLSLVKAVVEAHEGSVAVTSEPEKGSTFSVSLPCAPLVQPA